MSKEGLFGKVSGLEGKHVFTKSFGDGEINMITKKNDLTGYYVYFHSNADGEIKLDAEEFLADVDEVKPLG